MTLIIENESSQRKIVLPPFHDKHAGFFGPSDPTQDSLTFDQKFAWIFLKSPETLADAGWILGKFWPHKESKHSTGLTEKESGI